MSQPSSAPLAMYSSILALSLLIRSVDERSSMTKSGHRWRKPCCCCWGSTVTRSFRIQEASGERRAPLGGRESGLEGKSVDLGGLRILKKKKDMISPFC